jgi:hypothetical protein
MATKFFLLHTRAPFVPGSWRGGWDATFAGFSWQMDPFKFGMDQGGGGSTNTVSNSESTATTPWRVSVVRSISRRLAGQTISGTVDVVIGISESNADADFYWRLHLYVVKASDDSVVGTLLNGYEESAGGGGTEWPTTATARALQGAQTLSAVVVPSDGGDYRLVAEVGFISYNSHTTSRTGSIRTGGDQYALSSLNTLVAGDTVFSSKFGYIEFSGTVLLASDVFPDVSWEEASEIGTIPHEQTYDQRDAGFTYTRWFKKTATAREVWGVFGFSDSNSPSLRIYDEPDGTGLLAPRVDPGGNRPAQFGVAPSDTIYVEFEPDDWQASPGDIAVSILKKTVVFAP